jgi:hypothetical protein
VSDEQDALDAIEKRRAERKAEADKRRRAQRAIDLLALEELELEYGDGNVVSVDLIGWAPGLPTLVAARAAKPAEVKRYRSRVKVKHGEIEGTADGAEQIAASCVVYPKTPEEYEAILTQRPGVAASLGNAIIQHTQAKAESELKD